MVEKHLNQPTFMPTFSSFQEAIGFSPGGNLAETSVQELGEFFGLSDSTDRIRGRCETATQDILGEWKASKISPTDREAVLKFYQETRLYCYELIGLEYQFGEHRAKQVFKIAEMIKKIRGSQSNLLGCDFGSGVGTLGIYFNRQGLPCDFADVSQLNLDFISQRLKRRGIVRCKTILLDGEISNRALEANRYDFITAFDVLEHAVDPKELLRSMVSKLKVGGLLVFNLLYDNEEGTPHILRDPNLIRTEIRGMGMAKVGSVGEFKVYQKKSRWPVTNALLRGLDKVFWTIKDGVKKAN